jgi:hypothetical protein
MKSRLGRSVLLGMFAAAIPALAAIPARPGTLNYVEGSVTVDGREVGRSAVGSTDILPGSVLRTGNGKAEVLLAPGVFFRLGSNSEARLVSASLIDTKVALERGTAMLEAARLEDENKIQVSNQGFTTTLKDEGIYRFDAERPSVAVFDGKAEVREGDEKVELKKGKAVVDGAAVLKAEKFDRDEVKKTDELYQWSSVRSKYLSEASASAAQSILASRSRWYGPGWYWNPWMRTYSWLPARGFYRSPFGFGYYSPWYSSWDDPFWGPRYPVVVRRPVIVRRPAGVVRPGTGSGAVGRTGGVPRGGSTRRGR